VVFAGDGFFLGESCPNPVLGEKAYLDSAGLLRALHLVPQVADFGRQFSGSRAAQMFDHLFSEFVRAADPAGSVLKVPIEKPFVWRRGLTLRAVEPVAICVPSHAPAAGTAGMDQPFLFDVAVSVGVADETAGAAATHNYFMAAGNIARARREVEVTFKTPDQALACFVVVRDATFDY
jgi:hypothetical protein